MKRRLRTSLDRQLRPAESQNWSPANLIKGLSFAPVAASNAVSAMGNGGQTADVAGASEGRRELRFAHAPVRRKEIEDAELVPDWGTAPQPAATPAAVCRTCGAPGRPEASFCMSCGQPLVLGIAPRPVRHVASSVSDDAAMRLLLPVGRSPYAIAAGYLGLVSPLCIFAPFALIFGILAVRDIRGDPSLHGMGRAIFGIVMGALCSLGLIVGIVGLIMDR